jgi:hypothetical protein
MFDGAAEAITRLHAQLGEKTMPREEIRERLAEIIRDLKAQQSRTTMIILNVERLYNQCEENATEDSL